jgi:hypothetical protein
MIIFGALVYSNPFNAVSPVRFKLNPHIPEYTEVGISSPVLALIDPSNLDITQVSG